jgi:hypothetical protein
MDMHDTDRHAIILIMIVAIAAITCIILLLRVNGITGNITTSISEDTKVYDCPKDTYLNCITCCRQYADDATGKENYGKPAWSSIYNKCWKETCEK